MGVSIVMLLLALGGVFLGAGPAVAAVEVATPASLSAELSSTGSNGESVAASSDYANSVGSSQTAMKSSGLTPLTSALLAATFAGLGLFVFLVRRRLVHLQ